LSFDLAFVERVGRAKVVRADTGDGPGTSFGDVGEELGEGRVDLSGNRVQFPPVEFDEFRVLGWMFTNTWSRTSTLVMWAETSWKSPWPNSRLPRRRMVIRRLKIANIETKGMHSGAEITHGYGIIAERASGKTMSAGWGQKGIVWRILDVESVSFCGSTSCHG
jgi:hypothetical protein